MYFFPNYDRGLPFMLTLIPPSTYHPHLLDNLLGCSQAFSCSSQSSNTEMQDDTVLSGNSLQEDTSSSENGVQDDTSSSSSGIF